MLNSSTNSNYKTINSNIKRAVFLGLKFDHQNNIDLN